VWHLNLLFSHAVSTFLVSKKLKSHQETSWKARDAVTPIALAVGANAVAVPLGSHLK
jgi:hypothetical protein